MRFEKIWVRQCRATKGIKRRFGAKSALDYLIREKLQQNHAALVFDEFAYQFDSQTGQVLAGTAYRSTAYLVDVQETPEPSTFATLGAGTLVLFGLRRCVH